MRRTTTLLTLAALSLATVACSGEDAVESLVENAIEREAGGEVDIELGDDGSIDFEVDLDGDGQPDDISFDVDEDGSFDIDTGEGSMSMDEDGNFVVTDENGETITGDVNVDGDSFEVNTDDGSGSFSVDDDGTFTIENEDGSTFVVEQGTEIPDTWPSDVPQPSGLVIESVANSTTDDFISITVTASSPESESWLDGYTSALLDAGFTEQMKLSTPDGIQAGYLRGENENITILGFSNGDGTWGMNVSYTRVDS